MTETFYQVFETRGKTVYHPRVSQEKIGVHTTLPVWHLGNPYYPGCRSVPVDVTQNCGDTIYAAKIVGEEDELALVAAPVVTTIKAAIVLIRPVIWAGTPAKVKLPQGAKLLATSRDQGAKARLVLLPEGQQVVIEADEDRVWVYLYAYGDLLVIDRRYLPAVAAQMSQFPALRELL